MNVAPGQLYTNLKLGLAARILDVRNETEFQRWKIEGPSPITLLNLPYFEFLEHDDASVDRVKRWMGDTPGEIVVVCAKGDSSAFVAEMLQSRGLAAKNLEGGMVAWGETLAFTPIPVPRGLQAWQALRFGKGCLSYVIAEAREAIVVDPHRHVDDYRRFLKDQGLTLVGVFDTHLHADHISGAAELSRLTNVPYHGHPADFEGAPFRMNLITDRASLRLGDVVVNPVEFFHTPGHTPGSTSLLVAGSVLLTGDTLFVQSVGRPDLGGHAAEWGKALYRSLHGRLGELSDETRILPAHTGGPKEIGPDGIVGARFGDLRRDNDSMRLDEGTFLGRILSGIPAAPAHYDKIRHINLGRLKPSPEETTEMELGRNECALAGRK